MSEYEIKYEELGALAPDSFLLIDTRGEIPFGYGSIPNAVCVPDIIKAAEEGSLPTDKRLVLFCMRGVASVEQAEILCEMGYNACSLIGGYEQWLRTNCGRADRSREIELSITKRRCFKEKLFRPFTKAIVSYELVEPNDKIAVCISGGKDSMLMAKLFQELKRHRKFDFELVFLVMDPGYNEINRTLIENNAATMGIPIEIFKTDIFDSVFNVEKNPCYLCARMRRGDLYKKAQELGCNKIALGHHYDDVIETNLMSMLWGGQIQSMLPKLKSKNYEGMELIRPLYLVREHDIKAWRDANRLHFIECACRFTETCTSCKSDGSAVSKRMETKLLIKELKKTNPNIEANIFNSMHNVCLDTVIAYKKDGVEHSFLDNY